MKLITGVLLFTVNPVKVSPDGLISTARARLTAPFKTNTKPFYGINPADNVILLMLSDTTRPFTFRISCSARTPERTDRAKAYS